jgi:hypothetical protein
MSGPPWAPGKTCRVDGLGVRGAAEDEAAARAAQGLVGGGGDEIGVGTGEGWPGGDEPGDVGHVGEEEGADRSAISPMRAKSMTRE